MRRHRLADGRPGAHGFRQPYGSTGMFHDHAGDPQIACDILYPGGKGAVLQSVAIAARRAAAPAAVHPASALAVDRRRAARPARAGARAAARSVGENVRLHVSLLGLVVETGSPSRNRRNLQEQNRNNGGRLAERPAYAEDLPVLTVSLSTSPRKLASSRMAHASTSTSARSSPIMSALNRSGKLRRRVY